MAKRSSPFEWQRPRPERIVLPAAPGVAPSTRPPVRIFLGTEPAQFRAERTFVWSIVKTRDPSRVYEIHLMRELAGYHRWLWTTQFTNYRFAVPEYAGGWGRAIYNDVDQVYLSDPAELFDLDMGDHGCLTLSPRDTSVMLMDCQRMAEVWTLRDARRHRKRWLLGCALARGGLVGQLPREWNARDDEYRPGQSKCVHFTTLHLQPWRPFPERFVYREHPHRELWFELEEEADAAGFQLFDRAHPSQRWRRLVQDGEGRAAREGLASLDEAVRGLARRFKARSLLRLLPGAAPGREADPARWEVDDARRASLPSIASAGAPTRQPVAFDGVACLEGLEQVPTEDVGWVVDELFRRARGFVFAALAVATPRRRVLLPPAGPVRSAGWWTQHFESASKRYPDVHWQLALCRRGDFRPQHLEFRQGGRFPGDALPTVWVLADRKPGHVTQSVGLATELGWPYERIDLELSPLAEIPNPLLGATRLGLRPRAARALEGRTPDLVISTGRRASPVARWIRKQSRGRTRVVQLGREGVFPPRDFDLMVVPSYAGLLPHPRRMVVAAPLSRARRPVLEEARVRWGRLFEGRPRPHIGLLVGGHAPSYRLGAERARELGRDVRRMAESVGGSIFVTTSRRTAASAIRALQEELGEAAHFHRWSPDQSSDANPYLGYLALADAFVVTGESASMLADACSTGKPVFIYDVPRGVPGWRGILPRLTDRVVGALVARARHAPLGRRGFARPQRGLELLLSKLMARGVVRPTCNFGPLHEALVKQGLARRFDGTYAPFEPAPSGDLTAAADRVRRLLGVHEPRRSRRPW
jgi:mitochondrial fission protein ELM1